LFGVQWCEERGGCFVFKGVRREVVVRFVNICEIVDHHCLETAFHNLISAQQSDNACRYLQN